MSKTIKTPAAETLTGIALAIAVMGKAMTALSRANGAVWRSLQEAAGGFPATMTDADKTELSSQLSRQYRTKGGLDNAPQLASMHARAIYLIATGKPGADGKTPDPAKFTNMSAFFGAFSDTKGKTTKGHAGTSGASQGATVNPETPASATQHRADAGNAPANGAPTANPESASIGTLVTQTMMSVHGFAPELVQALQDIVNQARANPQLQDALVMARNNPAWFLSAAAAETARLNSVQAEKLAQVQAATAKGTKVAKVAKVTPAAPITAMAAALTAAAEKAAA